MVKKCPRESQDGEPESRRRRLDTQIPNPADVQHRAAGASRRELAGETYSSAGAAVRSPVPRAAESDAIVERMSPEQRRRHEDLVKAAALRIGLAINSLPRGTEARFAMRSGPQQDEGAMLAEDKTMLVQLCPAMCKNRSRMFVLELPLKNEPLRRLGREIAFSSHHQNNLE